MQIYLIRIPFFRSIFILLIVQNTLNGSDTISLGGMIALSYICMTAKNYFFYLFGATRNENFHFNQIE